MKRILVGVVLVLVVILGLLSYGPGFKIEEHMKEANPSPEDKAILMESCKTKKFIVTNPYNRFEKRVSNSFQYVSWDGGHWVAAIIGDTFYIRKLGSSRIFKTKFINVLRFRSSHWQVAFLPKENKFMVSRLNGITGMEFKTLDLFDWGYHTYLVSPV